MEQLFQHILSAGSAGSVIIVAVLLLRPLLKKGPGKFLCLLWLLAFLRLVMPFEIPSPTSLQPAMPHSVEVSSEYDAEFWDPADLPAAVPEVPLTSGEPAPDLLGLISWIWGCMAGLFLIHSLVSYLRLRLRVQDAIQVQGGWESEHIETAFILGFLRPRIYIPLGMDEQVRGYILAHEHTHLRRGDHWLKLLGYTALALHWFNPLVWTGYLLLCRDIELACDERVVRNMDLAQRKAYSAALLTCSANRPHLACPVAFGEVSVKERIRRVLDYRRPGLWITAGAAAALVFVAVCLMTSPAQRPRVLPVAQEADLSRIPGLCEEALEELKGRESYFVRCFAQVDCAEIPTRNRTFTQEFRRYGENFSTTNFSAPPQNGGMLWWKGNFAYYNGTAWIREVPADTGSLDPNGAILTCSPVGKTVTDSWTGEDGSLGFAASWIPEGHVETCSGTFLFRFREDGTLDSVELEYRHPTSDFATDHWVTTLTVQEEAPAVTRQILEDRASSVMTPEAFAQQLAAARQNREIPSNSMEYDRDLALGYGSMGWNLMGEQWFLSFGARNAGATSADLYFDQSRPGEGTMLQGSVSTGDAFSLEVFRDGRWSFLDPGKTVRITPRTVTAGSSLSLNWEDTYGSLPAGFYRIGMDYTLTTDSGSSDTLYCYAKFRLFPEEQQAALVQCRQGMAGLMAGDAYHIRFLVRDLSRTRNDLEETYYRMDLLKSVGQRLMTRKYYLFEDDSLVQETQTLLRDQHIYDWQDGKWVPSDRFTSEEAEARMDFWPVSFRLHDAVISGITRQGDCIQISSPFSGDEFRESRMDFFFDAAGNLTGIDKYYISEDGTCIPDAQMQLVQEEPAEILAQIPEIG